ncbi:VWA domain-containing protein [Nocardioides sp. AE5]|uniref:VWA domain-containing protein n=1 Tax=Nocardioides sp. AE5 TaxID=2962573 RepID=UPI0028818ABB|nr:VWA domain-containing protein [Nocardioides sp. AE5]MDT0201114.1 VWA domain-containing protein [Nocardioides sp. AE5]
MTSVLLLRPIIPAWLVLLLAFALLGVAAYFLQTRPRERTTWVIRALMIVVGATVLLRPGVGQAHVESVNTNLEVLVVVDRTTSMSALDWDGDQQRLDGVREDLAAITEALPGARFALLTFGRFVRTELPFSSDSGAFLAAAETMRREEPFDGVGSTPSIALDEMIATLERSADQHEDRERVVIFISDGENTSENPQESFAPVADLIAGGVVLGYGTTEGGRMQIDLERPDAGWVRDEARASDALSKIDEENLSRIADEMGVSYLHRTGPGGLDEWAEDLRSDFRAAGGGDAQAKHELYWIFALVLFGLALAELRISWRGLRAAHKEVASL